MGNNESKNISFSVMFYRSDLSLSEETVCFLHTNWCKVNIIWW